MGVGARGANSEVEADGAKYEVDAIYEYEYGNQNTPTDKSTVVRTVAAFSNLKYIPCSELVCAKSFTAVTKTLSNMVVQTLEKGLQRC